MALHGPFRNSGVPATLSAPFAMMATVSPSTSACENHFRAGCKRFPLDISLRLLLNALAATIARPGVWPVALGVRVQRPRRNRMAARGGPPP